MCDLVQSIIIDQSVCVVGLKSFVTWPVFYVI